MKYLLEFEKNIYNRGNYLYIIHDPTVFKIFNEWIVNYLIAPINYLQNIHLKGMQIHRNKQLILYSQKNSKIHLSIEEMKSHRNNLLYIHNSRGQYHSISILYFLEHASLVKNETFFPN